MTVLVKKLKPLPSGRVAMHAPLGGSAKSKRRRKGRYGVSARPKKKNRFKPHSLPQESKLASPPTAAANSFPPRWKNILTTLGVLSLFGAGVIHRAGELIWPPKNVPPFSRHDFEQFLMLAAPAPNQEKLARRTDGLWHNFIVEGAPLANEQLPALPRPTNKEIAAPAGRHDGDWEADAAPAQEANAAASLQAPSLANTMRLPNLTTMVTRPENTLVLLPAFVAPQPPAGLHWERLALVQTASLGATVYGFKKFDEFFGGAQKPFRWRNDWTKDHTLHFDELIHFQGGYRLAQGMIGMYRWAGLSPAWSEGLGAGTAASVMTFLEYIDGRRPKKPGASYSDFTANLLGVSFALAKLHVNALQDVDLRLNYTAFGDVLHKKTLLKYDRMTHWLTYDLERQWRVPLNVGIGYGVQNAFKPSVRSEFYLGVGLTPVDILARYYPTAAKPLAWLNMYHLGWQVQVK